MRYVSILSICLLLLACSESLPEKSPCSEDIYFMESEFSNGWWVCKNDPQVENSQPIINCLLDNDTDTDPTKRDAHNGGDLPLNSMSGWWCSLGGSGCKALGMCNGVWADRASVALSTHVYNCDSRKCKQIK